MGAFPLLPEDCIAHIISLTSPKDACRAATLSTQFKSAADSNAVWERFLPSDYEEIVTRSTPPVSYSNKRDLYFLLSDSDLCLDGGKLSFRLIKSNGKRCYMLPARELQIAWKETPEYWNWRSMPESRFAEVAELLHVFWLDICAIFPSQLLSPNTKYAAYMVFKISDDHHGLDCLSNALVRRVGESGNETEEGDATTVYIVPTAPPVRRRRWWTRPPAREAAADVRLTRLDGWMEIELGEFNVAEGEKFDIEIKLFEKRHPNLKKGLIVQGIEVRPKDAS